MSTKHLDERITTRYGKAEEEVYKKVIELVKKNGLPKSRAQYLLVERGLQHTQNPEPLVKEKVIYRDRPVEKVIYKDRPVEKIVYRDKESIPSKHLGIQEHIGVDNHITEQPASGQAQDSGQGKSAPNTALGVKKSHHSNEKWIVGGIGVSIISLLLYFFLK